MTSNSILLIDNMVIPKGELDKPIATIGLAIMVATESHSER
jgi:hypothetical protein